MTFQPSLRLVLVLLLAALTGLAGAPLQAKTAPRKKEAQIDKGAYKGAIVLDAAGGKILFEENADVVSPPASMAKLMTFAVLYDRLSSGSLTLQTPVTVTAPDSKIGGTQVWLKEGEIFPVEELLYAMMIQSANDAAYALARTSAGTSEAFVRQMNEKAKALGMTHTTFRSPHGLPPSDRNTANGDLTSPRDFALLCRHLLLNTDVLKYCSVKQRNFGSPVRVSPVVMINHNHLLQRVTGVDGLKTGFTNGAGFCLSATALRDGRRIIVVLMGSTDKRSRDNKVIELLEEGFAAIPAGAAPFAAATPKLPLPSSPSPFAPAPLPEGSVKPSESVAPEQPMIRFTPPVAPKKTSSR